MRLHPKKLAIPCLVVMSVAMSGARTVPQPLMGDEVRDVETARCTFDIIARNSGSVNVYLDLYTSSVFRLISGRVQLKIQNTRVGPGRTIPPQRARVGGVCKAWRHWRIRYRKGSTESMEHFYTKSKTRVSSASGNRVLDLGDVEKW